MVERQKWILNKNMTEMACTRGQVVGCFEDTDTSCCDGIWGGGMLTPLERMCLGLPPHPGLVGTGAMVGPAPRQKEGATGNG